MPNFNTFPAGGLLQVGGPGALASGSRAGTSLNAEFIFNTSGPSVSIRYSAQTTDTIDEFYIFLDDVGGTFANVVMEAEIRNENTTQATRAGSTVRATSTTTTYPSGVDMWVKFEFGTPYTPVIGEVLWFVVKNMSTNKATDFPIILTSTTHAIGAYTGSLSPSTGYTNTTGFTANSTGGEIPFVIKQGSDYFGMPFTQIVSTFYANNTRKRGIEFTLPIDVEVYGACLGGSNTAYSKFQIFEDPAGPGTTPLHEFNLDSDTNQTTNDVCGFKVFPSPVTLSAGVTYRAVLTFASNSQLPTVAQIEDYASYTAMFDAMRDEAYPFPALSTQDDGASGWTTLKSVFPNVMLFVNDYP